METTDDIGHLSIGEVLALLQAEFPDVTISKIRFLEAQGLIDPERTPSGYRKFYEPDIVRLRWILRQQRDHFLPLKVIKAKLEQGGEIDFESAIAVQPNLWSEDGAAPAPTPPMEAPWAPRAPGRTRPAAASPQASPAASAVATADADRPAPESTPPVEAPPAPAASPAAPAAAASPAVGPAAGSVTEPSASETVAGAEVEEHNAAAWLAALQESPRKSAPTRPAEPTAVGIGRGVRFGLAEVIEVTGVPAEAIESMIEYGLVTPMVIGGEATYDASSVAVVRAVAQFLARGVEPRHLRMFKNAAEREAGFYEQMILPLLKQRNPKARDQASATLGELAGAGDDLSRALVRQALRSHLGD
jgi:DNA-binding transcriptional MerR regulator